MPGVALAGPSILKIDVIKVYKETGQRYHVFLLKRTTPQIQRITYAFDNPSLTYI